MAAIKGQKVQQEFRDEVLFYWTPHKDGIADRRWNQIFISCYKKVLSTGSTTANECAGVNSSTRFHGGCQFKKRKFNNFNKDNSRSSTCFLCGKCGHKVKDCPELALARKWKNCKNFRVKASSNILINDEEQIEVGPNFILDSGSTDHIVNDKQLLTNIKMRRIQVSGAVGKDKIRIQGSVDIGNIHLKDVLYLPLCDFNIVSSGRLLEEGFKLVRYKNEVQISKNGFIYGFAKRNSQGLFVLENPVKPIIVSLRTEQDKSSNDDVIIRGCSIGSEGAIEDLDTGKSTLEGGSSETETVSDASPTRSSDRCEEEFSQTKD